MDGRDTLAGEVKAAIVRCLRMPIKPEEITDDMPLFDEGLGLDSIDALELVVLVEEHFRVTIPDETVGQKAFASINALADFILAAQAGAAA